MEGKMNSTLKSRFGLTRLLIVVATIALVIVVVGAISRLTAKGCKANPNGSSACEGCKVPSTVYIDTYKGSGGQIWSLDCRYFAVIDRHGSSLNPYSHWTVYETTTWKPACEVGEGDVMLGQGLVGGYCELPLLNGQMWVVLGGNPAGSSEAKHVRFRVCSDPKTCVSPSDIPPTTK